MSEELTLDQLFDAFTSEQMVKEATAVPTVRTGGYRFKVQKVTPQQTTQEDIDKSQRPEKLVLGRKSARISAALYSREDGSRKGSIFFNVSWEPNYITRDDGERKLDGQSKLWGQLLKALDATTKSVGEVLKEVLPNYLFDGFVDEAFKMPDGSLKSYRGDTEEVREKERRKLVDEGGEPVNFVQSIFKPKAA